LVKQFPADSTGLSNLAVVAAGQRDMPGALEIGRRASVIYPNNVLRRNNVALFALYGGDFGNAEKLATDVLGLNKTFEKAYVVTALAQLATGRSPEAEATWQRLQSVSDAGRDFAALGRADLAMYEGRLNHASSILEDALSKPPERRSKTTTARLTTTLAEVRLLQGRNGDAVKLAEDALKVSPDQSTVLLAGRVLIFAGKPDRGETLSADLMQKFDQQAQMFGKLLAGEAELKRGNARGAVGHFNEAQKIIDTWLGRDALGRAYLQADVYTDAQTEFDACLRRKGEATTYLIDDIPTYRVMASAGYYMGRAQEGQGSAAAKAAALESYKAFLTIKEKGDEQGLVADARRRLAALSAK
jgi:tetratricopeptide (TPR) repeat protein